MKWTKEYRKEYDKARQDRYTVEANKRKNDRRKAIAQWYRDLKSTLKCNRCPENHPGCLEFHHTSDKDDCVSALVRRACSIKRIEAEIAKCEVLCGNCHGKHHWEEKNGT